MVTDVLASTGGSVLAAATRAIAALRPARKPLHPDGTTVVGRLVRHGSQASGVTWLDEAGEDDVQVRLSRAAGLGRALPDVHGLAVRVPTTRGVGDLLLSSTGWGPLTRFVLLPGLRPDSRPLTCLLPYRTATGPLLVGARADGATYALSWAVGRGPWHRFATLELSEEPVEDQEVSFDAVRHLLPGLTQYPAVVRLREPSYRTARRSRGV